MVNAAPEERMEKINVSHLHIVVIGDVMLDRYWSGLAERMSPEAPVPVVKIEQHEERPGGAANVALNIASLQAKATMLGLIGDDAEGVQVEKALTQKKVVSVLKKISSAATIVKLRVLSSHQQLIRLDFENAFDKSAREKLWPEYIKSLSHCNAVIISDYQKGTVNNSAELIQAAKAKHIPVLVDPKGNHFSQYRGADVIMPNRKEFEAVVGKCESNKDIEEKGKKLQKEYDFKYIVITRGAEGMTVIGENGECHHLSTQAKAVYDVTGAGDTSIALTALGIADKKDILSAAMLANTAAGIVVSKLGPASVTIDELYKALNGPSLNSHRILTEKEIVEAVKQARNAGEKIIMTNGCFDILHPGHVHFLEEAKSLGHRLIVAVNDDVSVKKLKGNDRPIHSLKARCEVLAGLRAVDWVVAFSEETPEKLIHLLTPDVLVKGGDYKIGEIAGSDYLLKHGCEVKILSYLPDHSTSGIIKKIKK